MIVKKSDHLFVNLLKIFFCVEFLKIPLFPKLETLTGFFCKIFHFQIQHAKEVRIQNTFETRTFHLFLKCRLMEKSFFGEACILDFA